MFSQKDLRKKVYKKESQENNPFGEKILEKDLENGSRK